MQQHGFPKARMLQHKLINAQTPAAEWRNSLAQRVALGTPNKKQKPASAGDSNTLNDPKRMPHTHDANKLFNPSAKVGCAKIPSRNVPNFTLPRIAISNTAMISPPSIPKTVAP